jgi:hypothetical protein
MLLRIFIIALMLLFTTPAVASDIVSEHIPDAKIVGKGRLSVILWDVYDATLYAPENGFDPQKPFILSIRYMREIEGSDIADRSVQEIQKQGFNDETKLADWNRQMKDIFPNVKDGTMLYAVFKPGKKTLFYHDSNPVGTINDAAFTQRFADIWLGEKTSEPSLRKKLLGL